jgi:hypothetical protein
MKKLIFPLLIFITLLFSLSSCTSGSEKPEDQNGASDESVSQTASSPTEQEDASAADAEDNSGNLSEAEQQKYKDEIFEMIEDLKEQD